MKKALYVDTMIGTVGDGQIEKSHGGGKTYPGACVPGLRLPVFPGVSAGSHILLGVGHVRKASFPLQNRLLWAGGSSRNIKARPPRCSPPALLPVPWQAGKWRYRNHS